MDLISLALVPILLVSLYIYMIQKISYSISQDGELPTLRKNLLLLCLASILAGFIATYTFGSAFGVGMAMVFFSLVATPIAIIIVVIQSWVMRKHLRHGLALKLWFGVAMILMVIFMASPLVGIISLSSICDQTNLQKGNEIIHAVETYKGEHDAYPDTLEILVPDYITKLPKPSCFTPYRLLGRNLPEYQFLTCKNGDRLLEIPLISYEGIEQYRFSEKEWFSMRFINLITCR